LTDVLLHDTWDAPAGRRNLPKSGRFRRAPRFGAVQRPSRTLRWLPGTPFLGRRSGLRRRLGCFLRPLAGLLGGVQLSCSSVMSATWASRCASAASALTVA